MTAELPALPETAPAGPPTGPRPHEPPDADEPPRASRFSPGLWAAAALLGALVIYGGVQLLRQTGVYDVTRWWSSPPPSPRLSDLGKANPTVASAPVGSTAARPPDPGRVRDQPPRPPAAGLPQFTIRDGAQYDFMLDLDAETLKRLAEIQGQLDGLGAVVGQLNQAVQALARHGEGQRQQEAVHQGRVQQDLGAARQEIAALRTALGEVEARLKRARAGQGPGGLDAAASGGRALPGWSVTAISGDRAWLRSPKGQAVTAVAGDRLKGAGAVRAVDAARGVVTLDDGRVVR